MQKKIFTSLQRSTLQAVDRCSVKDFWIVINIPSYEKGVDIQEWKKVDNCFK